MILREDGAQYADNRPLTRLNVSVIVEADGRRETGTAGGGGRYGLSTMLDPAHWQPLIDEALRIACVNLEAVDAPAGVMDVVLGPGWPGILLHEAVGHGLEGDFNRKGSSAFAGLMGKQVASRGVTVLDDGTIPDRRGSISVDDEGTRVGQEHPDRRRHSGGVHAGPPERAAYGCACDRQRSPPVLRAYSHAAHDQHLHAGRRQRTPRRSCSDLKDGIYAVGFGGGQVDITNGKFVFSCTEAYRVKDGKVGAPVKGATLIGDGATALKQIRAIGNDMALDPGMGNCGKQGQWVPVGVGLPTLLIGGLTVGGAAT